MRIAKFLLALVSLTGVSSLALAQRGYHGHLGRPAVDPQEKVKIQANDAQRDQLHICLSLSERLRLLAADLRKPAHLSESEWVRNHRRWNEVLRQAMESHHQAFLERLNADQRATLRDRLRTMDKTSLELSSRFETVDADLADAAPDAGRVSAHAKELEKNLKKWHKQHRKLGSEMGIEI